MNRQLLTLPSLLIADVRALPLPRPTQNNCLLFLHETLKLSHYVNHLAGAPVGFCATAIKKDFFGGGDYRPALELLKKNGILEIDETYFYDPNPNPKNKEKKNKTKTYSVNFDYLLGEYETLIIHHKKTLKDKVLEIADKEMHKVFKACKFDGEKARQIITTYVASDHVSENWKIKTGDEITGDKFEKVFVLASNRQSFITLERVKKETLFGKWGNRTYRLFKTKDTFYFMPPADFREMKQTAVLWHYTHVIAMWEDAVFFAHRDKTTYRLHSLFTYTPKMLLPCVTIAGGNFIDFDLSNSQFCILAYCLDIMADRDILQNRITDFAIEAADYWTPSTVEFCEAARGGRFYKAIQTKLGLQELSMAKMAAFETLFSSAIGKDKDTPEKAGIRYLFPDVVDLIDRFKEKCGHNGYKELPIELQRVESRIMIDIVRPALLEAKIKHFTKHDAFYVSMSSEQQARAIIETELSKVLGMGNFKI